MNNEQLIRTFLAIDPSPEIISETAIIQNRLKNIIQGNIRWVRPEGIHLTLKFFGNLSAQDIVKISEVAGKNVAVIKPLALEVNSIGVFPDLTRPRVLWLGMDGDVNPLVALQKKIDRDLQPCGFKREENPFHPHLTLGRIRSHRGLVGLGKVVESTDDYYHAGKFYAEGLTLFKSDLTPKGAVYTKLSYFPFSGGLDKEKGSERKTGIE
jgi:2'-5' RNA ligase